MKICFITPYPLRSIGGVTNVVTELCKGLQNRDIDHLVISGRLIDEIEKDGAIEAIEIDVSGFSNLKDTYLAVKTVRNILRHRKDVDLLHLQSPHLQPMLSAITGKILGKPVIATIHGKFPRPNSVFKRFYLWATIKGTIAFSDKITFVDEKAKKHYNVLSGEVIENGIDTQIFAPDSVLRVETQRNLGISGNDVVLLFLGRLVAHKGIFDLIDAFSEVRTGVNRPLKLIVIGTGEVEEVSKKISDLKLEGDVMLLGKVKEVRNFYAASDIFVLYTSPLEGLPIALLEASSSGLAIISTRVSGIPSVITDKENGLLLEYGDKTGLIRSIQMLTEDEGLRENLGKNARKGIIERYDISRTIDRYVDLYKMVLRDNGS